MRRFLRVEPGRVSPGELTRLLELHAEQDAHADRRRWALHALAAASAPLFVQFEWPTLLAASTGRLARELWGMLAVMSALLAFVEWLHGRELGRALERIQDPPRHADPDAR